MLWLFFEDMKEDLAGAVARVAEFTGAGAGAGAGGAARRALAAERSGFEFMRAHASQARARPRINHPPARAARRRSPERTPARPLLFVRSLTSG